MIARCAARSLLRRHRHFTAANAGHCYFSTTTSGGGGGGAPPSTDSSKTHTLIYKKHDVRAMLLRSASSSWSSPVVELRGTTDDARKKELVQLIANNVVPRLVCTSRVVTVHAHECAAMDSIIGAITKKRPRIVYIHVDRAPRAAATGETTLYIGVPLASDNMMIEVHSFVGQDRAWYRTRHKRMLHHLLAYDGIIKVCTPGISSLNAVTTKDAGMFKLHSMRQVMAGGGCSVYGNHDLSCAEMLGWVPEVGNAVTTMLASHHITMKACGGNISNATMARVLQQYKKRVHMGTAFMESWEVHRHPELHVAADYSIEVLTEPHDIEHHVRSRILDDLSVTTIGFDTETKPYGFRKGHVPAPDLIQLGTRHMTLLVQLHKCATLPAAVCEVMTSSRIKKVGVAVHNDGKQLASYAGAPSYEQMDGFVELADMAAQLGIANSGLSALCCHLLGQKLSKEERMTDWSKKVLTEEQVRYAAVDAYAGVLLYDRARELLALQEENKK